MLPRIASWEHAMTSIDLTQPARPQKELWGYWIPEPGLLLRPQNPDRLHRYLFNWLRMRQAWLYVLRLREARAPIIPTQWWRDFLYGDTGQSASGTTSNAKRIAQMKEVFGLAFEEAHFEPATTSTVRWFEHSLRELDTKHCPMIIWEVCELGFRHELLALDRLLVPSRDGNLGEEHRDELLGLMFLNSGVYAVTQLPPKEGVGLSANLPRRRVPHLEAFRKVMGRWPRCPPSFFKPEQQITTAMQDDVIVAREQELVNFYVHTFFEQSGRAPIVPHRVPF